MMMTVLTAVSCVAEGCLGMLLFVSGLGKAFSQRDLLSTIAAYRILPRQTSYSVYALLAFLLPTGEIVLGGAIMAGFVTALAGSAILLGIFALGVSINMARGRTAIRCGCNLVGQDETLSWWIALRAVLLTLLALSLVFVPADMSFPGSLVSRLAGAVLWLTCLAALRLHVAPVWKDTP